MTAMRFSDLSGQKHRRHRAARGSTLLITLLLTATLSLEVIVLSVTLTRGLGEEAVLAQAHVIARQNAELAFTRSAERLRAFLASASPQEADIAFSRGGRKSWQGASLSQIAPDARLSADTPARVSVWLERRRGSYYLLACESRLEKTRLLMRRWVSLP
ncbi:MAG: hypothetical protein IPK79_06435 [Vampirovibrionales bacterium]|nr:hypothetical protein [Vampirovibrionales bacterium]